MDSHKKQLKSVCKELGWGHAKHGLDKRRRPKGHRQYKLRLMCPKCSESDSDNVVETRADFWWCRKCGYEGDVDSWLEN